MKNIYLSKTSKVLRAVLFTLMVFATSSVYGKYTITKFPALSLCSAYPSAYTTGSFSLNETSKTGFSGFTKAQTGTTLILGFSNASFEFNPGIGTVTVSGTEVTIVSYSILASSITVTITTAATNNELNVISFNSVQVKANAAATGFIQRTGGTFKVDNKTTKPPTTQSWGDLTALVPVAYSTSSATQAVTSTLFSGSTNNQILGVQVVITGTCGTLTATAFNFNTTGSTAPATDILNAKLYYTSTTNVFSTATLFGSVSSPNGAFTINGSQVLNFLAGTYYFWLTYDITEGAVNNNFVDAQHISTVISGTTYADASGNPAGNRQISSNVFYSIATGVWSNTTTVWSRTSGGPACSCAPTGGSGFVNVEHAVSLDNNYTVNFVTAENGGNLTNAPTRVLTVTDILATTGNGVFSASTAWALKDVTTSGTGISSSSSALTLTGSLNVGVGTTFQMTGGVLLTVNGNITTNGTLALGTSNVTNSNAAGTIVQGTGNITGSGIITLGVNKTIPAGSNLTVAPVINIPSPVVISNNGTVNMQNNITGGGVNAQWTNAANSVLDMGGTTSALLATGKLDASAVSNAVSYSGSGNQDIKTPLTSYYNLYASSSATGIKSLQAALVVDADIQISTGAQLNAAAAGNTITLNGNWINNSTNTVPFNPSTSTVFFNGGANTISGSGITSFNNVTINAISILTSNSSLGKVRVLGNWVCDGSFNHNNSDITFDGTSTISGLSFTTFNTAIVNAAKTLILHATQTDFDRDITSNGTLNHNSGLVVFTGIGITQNINGSAGTLTLFSVEVSNPAGSVLLARSLTINSALTLTTGILSIGANTITLTGAVTGSGTFTGSSSSNMVIAGAAGTLNFTQTSAATRSLNNLTLNSGSSATLGNALDVYGTITLTTATLNLNAQNLTLKSNTSNTARIANLTGSTLSGATNVTMERWIKLRLGGTGRAYRLLAPSVNTTGSINANWMEGGMNTAIGTNVNPVPLFGTQITGAGGNANGFDRTQTNQSSFYSVTNAVAPTYTPVVNTSGTLNARTGYFLYIRGDRSMDMTIPLAVGMPTSSTTLRTTGTVLTGTQTSFTNPFIGGAGALNLVTNPYPSPIDWSLVQPACTNVASSYTYWDANIGTRGGFATVTTGGVSVPATSATQFIQSGQAFFVQSTGGLPTVSIQESHKSAGNNNNVFIVPPPPVESFRTELYFTEPNGYRRVADGAIAVFGNRYSAEIDGDDASEINNWDENIAISKAGKRLAIESRPVIFKTDSLELFMNNMKQQEYEFEFTPSVFTHPGLKAELVDNFTGSRTLLSLTDPSVVKFTVTSDPASAATNRFKVLFNAIDATPVSTDKTITIYPNPVDNRIIGLRFNNAEKGNYYLRLVNSTGQVVMTRQVYHGGGNAIYNLPVNSFIAWGRYTLEILKPDNKKLLKSLVIIN